MRIFGWVLIALGFLVAILPLTFAGLAMALLGWGGGGGGGGSHSMNPWEFFKMLGSVTYYFAGVSFQNAGWLIKPALVSGSFMMISGTLMVSGRIKKGTLSSVFFPKEMTVDSLTRKYRGWASFYLINWMSILSLTIANTVIYKFNPTANWQFWYYNVLVPVICIAGLHYRFQSIPAFLMAGFIVKPLYDYMYSNYWFWSYTREPFFTAFTLLQFLITVLWLRTAYQLKTLEKNKRV